MTPNVAAIVGPSGDAIAETTLTVSVDYGPGYRVYYVQHGKTLVILLCGGIKKRQESDIRTAKALAKEL